MQRGAISTYRLCPVRPTPRHCMAEILRHLLRQVHAEFDFDEEHFSYADHLTAGGIVGARRCFVRLGGPRERRRRPESYFFIHRLWVDGSSKSPPRKLESYDGRAIMSSCGAIAGPFTLSAHTSYQGLPIDDRTCCLKLHQTRLCWGTESNTCVIINSFWSDHHSAQRLTQHIRHNLPAASPL